MNCNSEPRFLGGSSRICSQREIAKNKNTPLFVILRV